MLVCKKRKLARDKAEDKAVTANRVENDIKWMSKGGGRRVKRGREKKRGGEEVLLWR